MMQLPDFLSRSELREGLPLDTIQTYANESDEFDSANDVVSHLRDAGYDIKTQQIDDQPYYFISEDIESQYSLTDTDGSYELAIISDTHLGSEVQQLSSLHEFYDTLADEDIDTVFHAGDISDGCGVYRGHEQHKVPEAIGWGRLIDYVSTMYPERDDMNTFFIEGNHDHKLFKDDGIRFGEQVADDRDDLHYLGDSYANIMLEDDIDLDLVHPSGGSPYTLGYRAQTWLRDKPDEAKADITVFGHLHQFLNAATEGSEAMYAGAWQGSTPYTERKGFKPKAGGWIVDFEIDEGIITDWSTRRLQYPVNTPSQHTRASLEAMAES